MAFWLGWEPGTNWPSLWDQEPPDRYFSFRRPHLRFPRVLEDHADAAQLVADHFLTRGFANFLFYSDAANWSYDERGQGFVDALKRTGHSCRWLKWHESPAFRTDREQWKRKRVWLATELKRTPKPVGLFAANDQHALDVLEACQSAGLVVPDQVSIVGAENYLLAADAMHMPVSSVDTNLETLGYRGAKLLDQLISGKSPPADPIRIPAAGVVVRKSSDLLAVTHPGVARSLRFIWEHFQEPITVKDLVGVAAMSRRGLHNAFLEHLGRAPGEELHRVRIERAKKLLRESRTQDRSARRHVRLSEREQFLCHLQASHGAFSPSNSATSCTCGRLARQPTVLSGANPQT